MKLLIVTNAPTFKEKEKFVAYAPYVKEMDIWFRNAQEVGILSPESYPEAVFTKPFILQKINFYRVPFLRFSSFLDFIKIIFIWPVVLFQFIKSFIWADHIHLRCPGNIGFIGSIVQVFFPNKTKTAKYAGNWDPNAEQPLSYRLQKKLLKNTFLTRNMTVLVYGDWPEQTSNIIPFFTASFKNSEKERFEKEHKVPFKFVFAGNLVPGKNPILAAKIVKDLNRKNIFAELHIYGDGILMQELKEFIADQNFIHLHGNQPLEVVKHAYKESHFVILPSKSEGWPKAVAEGMFFGCIPIATSVSCVPWMLGALPSHDGPIKDVIITKRGILVPPPCNNPDTKGEARTEEWLEEISCLVANLICDKERMKRMSMEAQKWSQQYTLEKFEEAIKEILSSSKMTANKSSSPIGKGGREG